MKQTKQYLRYVPAGKFNIITSSKCNVSFLKLKSERNRFVVTGASEDVIIWDSRLGKKVTIIEGEKSESTYVKSFSETEQLAIGYADGTVIIHDLKTGENITTFAGHRSPVTSIAFDKDGHRIATGSKDTDVIVWDVVAESGVFRLSGHKGPITHVEFMKTRNIVVSSSKDTFVKFWDLTNGHCFKTLTGHVTEVWSFCLMKDDSYLVTGTNDSELRVWRISDNDASTVKTELNEDSIDYGSPIVCEKIGSILRKGFGRVISMASDSSSQILCCHGNEKSLELFYFVPEEEAIERCKKKQKKLNKKMKLSNGSTSEKPDTLSPSSLTFIVTRLPVVRTDAKIKYSDVWYEHGNVKIVNSLNNNSLAFYSVPMKKSEKARLPEKASKTDEPSDEVVQENAIINAGHNSDIRTVSFTHDNSGIISGSATGLKVWKRDTLTCLRTIETDYILSVCSVPGDRYVLAGLKNGNLLIADIGAADVVETIAAHEKELWSVSILPNKLGCITCGGDNSVKIWNIELMKPNETEVNTSLTLIHTKTLMLDDPVLQVSVSPDSNLIVAALLDSTIKMFFMDSLKFFLCLYGHKLPITCFDVSYDSALIATGSADRNVKIWGMDYGDCHKSLFAHEDTVTGLKFVPNTHYFFTCGKDGLVKQWDADNFERILTLEAHHGEAWSLAVSPNGRYFVSCGQDRVLRMFEKSDEPLVLEDERETEREKEEETTLATGSESVVQGRSTLHLATKKTVSAEKGAELLLECLDVMKDYKKAVLDATRAGKEPPIPPIMTAFGATNGNEYFIAILRKIRSSDLEEILALLNLSSVCELLENLLLLLETPNNETETIIRILVFLLKAHHKPIISSGNLRLVLHKLQNLAFQKINNLKNTVGCNLHGLLYIQRENEFVNI